MISLRFAHPEDAAALLEIYRPYVENTAISFETKVPNEAEFRSRMLSFSAYPYLVAVENGTPLGYAYAHAFHERAAYDWTVETSIYVSENARGRHVGTLLYHGLLKLLEAQGIQNACAVITIPNQPSLDFHRALGFETAGILPDFGYKLGAWHSVAYLFRPLGPANPLPAPVTPIGNLDAALTARILAEAVENS